MRRLMLMVIAVLGAGCVDAVSSDQEIFFLKAVDGTPLPVELSTDDGFTVFATVGHLAVPRSRDGCDYIIRYERVSSIGDVTGTLSQCPVDPAGGVEFDLDLGGTPKPVGSHRYRFARK